MKRKLLLSLTFSSLMLLIGTPSALGQGTTSRVTGTVLDQQGAFTLALNH